MKISRYTALKVKITKQTGGLGVTLCFANGANLIYEKGVV